jgi:hypothetical protein
MNFDGDIVDHKLLLLLNSNFEARMRIPKHLSNSPQVVFSELCATRTCLSSKPSHVSESMEALYGNNAVVTFPTPDDYHRRGRRE